jgi:hypothetical protein
MDEAFRHRLDQLRARVPALAPEQHASR